MLGHCKLVKENGKGNMGVNKKCTQQMYELCGLGFNG